MSLKQEIETWVLALAHYDNNDFEDALKVFESIADTSKIQFNCGVIYATLGEHVKAVECYQRAIAMDKYFAIAYFQQGVSNFLLGDFEEALVNFNDTLLYLRGNSSIDYDQLGLKFQLFSCEVLFNRGLCYIYLGQMDTGMKDLQFASKEKTKPDHDVIDEAIRETAEGYTVFSIPVGVVYRPSDAKVKNLKTKEYLGKPRLIAASDRGNAFTGFQGSEIKRNNNIDKSRDDRPPESLSYAASNLVQPGLSSRSRQQSEPPISRNVFPPTPPPENDKPASMPPNSLGNMPGRSASVRAPQRTGYEVDPFNPRPSAQGSGTDLSQPERPRIGTIRTASEPRGPPARQLSRRDQSGRQQQPLYRETTGLRRTKTDFAPVNENGPIDDVYDTYRAGNRISPPKMRLQQFAEEDEYASDVYEDDSADDEEEFEMVRSAPARPMRRGTTRRVEVRKIRVKVHSNEDTRFIIVGPAIEFGDFEGKIREKFGFRSRLRIKMRDDGDMVTLADQDDLDLLLSTAKKAARKAGNDMGKMEVWVSEQ